MNRQITRLNINLAQSQDSLLPKQRLSRETKIIKHVENEPSHEYTISFNDIINQITEANLLGSGRFGVVWRVHHDESNLDFARISNSAIEPSGMVMDLDVPKQLGNDCPFIIKFYGAIDAESYYWIFNERMDTSIDRFFATSFELELKMEESFISKVANSILSALSFMKSKNFIHRDIKPSNILINKTGEIKVCDFGISGLLVNSVAFSYKGSDCYMAPEKIQMLPTGYTIKADIWSLGITMIEIAANKHPFAGKELSSAINLITSETDPSPKLDPTLFSSELCQFVDKCLYKNFNQRSNYSQLLTEPFITNYLNIPINLDYVRGVIQEIPEIVPF